MRKDLVPFIEKLKGAYFEENIGGLTTAAGHMNYFGGWTEDKRWIEFTPDDLKDILEYIELIQTASRLCSAHQIPDKKCVLCFPRINE